MNFNYRVASSTALRTNFTFLAILLGKAPIIATFGKTAGTVNWACMLSHNETLTFIQFYWEVPRKTFLLTLVTAQALDNSWLCALAASPLRKKTDMHFSFTTKLF